MSLPQKVQVCWQPLPWVLNKLCRQKIIGFSSVTIVILKSNFFFTATRAQHKRGLTELGSTGSWAAEPALKELIPATSKNQTGHLMKTFKTSSSHSETSEICIKSGFFAHLNAGGWIHVATSGRLFSKELEEQGSTCGSREAQGDLTSAFKCLALAKAIKILRSKCMHTK